MKMFIVKSIEKVISAAAVIMLFTSCVSRPDAALFTDPNNYSGSDIERINAALRDAQKYGGICRISRRRPDAVSNREYWLIDSAISVPGNTTLYINNCKIKLSDLSRDNWIRSANCQPGKSSVELLTDIHIIGEGSAVLEGADHPRSTGDSGKILGQRTYGTDAGKTGESQKGDWRNVGVLLVKVKNFSLRNLRLINSHAWAVSLEFCQNGIIRDLDFASEGKRSIDGKTVATLNQDGLDLRHGCRNILIENITGVTGDDLIALSAFKPSKKYKTGSFAGTEFLKGGKLEDCHVFNISIRNVRGYCAAGYRTVRFLNNGGVKMYNIKLSDVMDTSPRGLMQFSTVLIGDFNYGGAAPTGDTSHFQLSNIHSKAKHAVIISGSLTESSISNVLSCSPVNAEAIRIADERKVRGIVLNNINPVKNNGR